MTNGIAPAWDLTPGNDRLVAVAVHDGHDVRPDLLGLMALNDANRLREEDPHTGGWTSIAPTRIVVRRSRFEVDLNRPREKAVYVKPEDAWGLTVWKTQPSQPLIDESLSIYDAFYSELRAVLHRLVEKHSRIVVYDIHSYNHLRDGVDSKPADPEANPEVNIGTGSLDRRLWAPVIDRLICDLRATGFVEEGLDVRENVKFRGGYLSKWIHKTFPGSACCLAIEFKKVFMNEWTGEFNTRHIRAIEQSLRATVPGVLEELEKL